MRISHHLSIFSSNTLSLSRALHLASSFESHSLGKWLRVKPESKRLAWAQRNAQRSRDLSFHLLLLYQLMGQGPEHPARQGLECLLCLLLLIVGPGCGSWWGGGDGSGGWCGWVEFADLLLVFTCTAVFCLIEKYTSCPSCRIWSFVLIWRRAWLWKRL